MSQKEREIVAYHESATPSSRPCIPDMDPVHKISIVQRGFGALGYTMQLPLEDRYLMQRQRPAQSARGAARRPHGRGDRARRDFHRRAERPAARHRHRPRDGHRMGHERRARRHQLRRPQAQQVPRHPDRPGARRLRGGHREADRRRGEADHDRRARRGAADPLRPSRHARDGDAPAARAGGHGRRRAARAPQPAAGRGGRVARKHAAAARSSS